MTGNEGPAGPYDPDDDPDSDPDNLITNAPLQPDQAEGEDVSEQE
ncbi:hypothetical protein ACIBED_04595 [Rhodococcus coprophilus]|uniref:Uncharacterized protein n=1 Tax=Rhodococcus coprophilus TaxID=38310 RepID=A0A2X4TN07_9NOCA|nr:hypothetical protein [Rhodococcus coprophilus]MBM7460453.1 hypothetical protein [Rhodococcus coprophilus]SQI28263.1 Uncharacterised protein [Rhodococcus coprophilus]